MKIIHFSDPHSCAAPEEWGAFFDKRIVGFFNYIFRRRFQHDLEILDQTVEFILKEKPDVAVCTGDLSSTGQPTEFAATLKKLEPLLKQTDIQLLFVPGNHDAYVKSSSCRQSLADAFAKMNRQRWQLDELPVKTIIGDFEFILVNECRPTNIVLSCGFMSPESVKSIKTWCKEEKTKPRIIIGHFPILKNYSFLEKRRGLNHHEEVRELVKNKKIDLSLCGHMHLEYAQVDNRGKGEICAGSVTRTGIVSVIEYNKNDDTFSYKFQDIRK